MRLMGVLALLLWLPLTPMAQAATDPADQPAAVCEWAAMTAANVGGAIG